MSFFAPIVGPVSRLQGESTQKNLPPLTEGFTTASNGNDEQKNSNERGVITWIRQCPLQIPIPTTGHDAIFDLIHVWSIAKDSHERQVFELSALDNVVVYSQEQWRDIELDERGELFREKNILVKNNSNQPHPFPIMSNIKTWNRKEIGRHFDLYGARFMQDQTWASKRAILVAGKSRPIARVELMDDGKNSAVQAILGTGLESLAKVSIPRYVVEETPAMPGSKVIIAEGEDVIMADVPTPVPTPQENDAGNASLRLVDGTPPPREDVTLADVRNVPDLRLRCATLDQFLRNRERDDVKNGTSKPAIVNFLDIPMSGQTSFALPVDGLDMSPNLQAHNDPQHAFASEIPHTDFRWALCASAGAISTTHMDAGGFAMHIRVILGKKLWFIGIPQSTLPEACVVNSAEEKKAHAAIKKQREAMRKDPKIKPFSNPPRSRKIGKESYVPYISIHNGFVIGGLRWVLVVIGPGDDL